MLSLLLRRRDKCYFQDSQRFGRRIHQSMQDMRELFGDETSASSRHEKPLTQVTPSTDVSA